MRTEILIPKIGMTMLEATIASWLVADGDEVEAGAPLLLIESEKSEIEVEAPSSGSVRRTASAGQTLPVGAVIGWVDTNDRPPPPQAVDIAGVASSSTRRAVSPRARRIAIELGVDTAAIVGTGPNNRVVSEDVERAAAVAAGRDRGEPEPAAPAPVATAAQGPETARATTAAHLMALRLEIDISEVNPEDGQVVNRRDVEIAAAARRHRPRAETASTPAVAQHGGRRRRMTVMRRTIAARITASLAEAAQLTLNMEVTMSALIALRAQLRDEWGQFDLTLPSVNDFVLRATALALREHPVMNARIEGDEIVEESGVHLGMAVALEDGLIVPVIRSADERSLADIAAAARELAAAARSGSLAPADYEGGTFSVSNLGTEGVDAFTPIINPPNVGILGVGTLRDGTKWTDDGAPHRVALMTLSLTWDHRAVDGVPAARFAATVRRRLEAPTTLL